MKLRAETLMQPVPPRPTRETRRTQVGLDAPHQVSFSCPATLRFGFLTPAAELVCFPHTGLDAVGVFLSWRAERKEIAPDTRLETSLKSTNQTGIWECYSSNRQKREYEIDVKHSRLCWNERMSATQGENRLLATA